MVVCPCEFHKLWNQLKGIFKLFGVCFLFPVAKLTGRSAAVVDRECKASNFRGCCILVHHIVAAAVKLIDEWCMQQRCTVVELIEKSQRNRPLHNFIYCVFYFLAPWVVSHKAVRGGNFNRVFELDRIWLQLFIITGKVKYTRLVGLWHYVVNTLAESWKNVVAPATPCQWRILLGDGWSGRIHQFEVEGSSSTWIQEHRNNHQSSEAAQRHCFTDKNVRNFF